ncbi:zinc finger protein 555 [Bicyclus anynana]|uniref:Zinc finger protein 555 n=1 Tax=Bicyclus anynana TaxID=110368 RepID=A0ABM3M5S8_BICAN|nr:zinc finger protein 555 [Bicyclus anynana]
MELRSNSDVGRVKSKKPVSTAKFCVVCLATDCKLYPLSKYGLAEAYRNLTDKSLLCNVNFAPEFCTECAQRLVNCDKFRDKSLRSFDLLLQLCKRKQVLTTEDIKEIDRTQNQLASNISQKIYNPDHCDSHVIHNPIEQTGHLQIDIKPKIEELNDANSEEEYLADDIDHGTEFIYEYNEEKHTEIDTDDSDQFIYIKNETLNKKCDNVTDSESDVEIINDVDDEKKLDTKNSDYVLVIVEPKDTNAVEKGNTSDAKKRKKAVKKDELSPKRKTPKMRLKKKTKKSIKSGNQDYLKYFEVTKLSLEEQLATIQSRKEAPNFKKSRYKCMTCYKGFSNVTTYEAHMARHTDKYGPFVCEICGLHNKSSDRYRHHVKNHSRVYSCNVCPFVTTYDITAEKHALWHDGITYKCEICSAEFSKKTTYLSHLRIWHPSDVVCTLCGCSFINDRGLRLHMSYKHRSNDIESPSGPKCEPCNIRFASESAYQQHLDVSLKHADDSTLEPDSPKIPNNKLNMKHAPRSRQDIQTVECELCGTQLKGFKLYALHFSKIHPDKTSSQLRPNLEQFLCDQCGKSFKYPSLLKDHQLVHSGVRKYQSDKSYPCPICGKKFTLKGNTDRHMWTHKNVKPFKCHSCEKTFVNPSDRARHVLHVHLKQPWPKKNPGPRIRRSRTLHAKETSEIKWPKGERDEELTTEED